MQSHSIGETMFHWTLVLLLFLAGGTSTGQAECQKEDGDLLQLSLKELLAVKIQVGTSVPETVQHSGSAVTVIDQKTIEAYGFLSVAEAIRIVAGISVPRTYLKQHLATARGLLQDHYANKVLIMIDGIPVWNAVTGEGNLDRINIHDVATIEVLRGPASVQYGSQAYSGAINIILKDADPGTAGGTAYAGFGTDGGYTAGMNYAQRDKNGHALFGSVNTYRSSKLDQTFVDENGEAGEIEDFFRSDTLNLRLDWGEQTFLVNASQGEESYLGVTPTFSSGAGNPQDLGNLMLGWKLDHRWSKKMATQMQVFGDWSERNLSRSRDNVIRARIRGYRTGGRLAQLFDLTEDIQLELGMDYDYRHAAEYTNYNKNTEQTLADNNLKNRSIYEYSAFGQLKINHGKARLQLGTRWTKNQLFGSNLSSRLSLAYQIHPRHTLKLIGSQSFRTPSLFEFYFITPTQTVFGNQNLDPETSDSLELLYQYTGTRLFLQASLYHAIYRDRIMRVTEDVTLPDGTVLTNRSVYANGERFSANGLELEGRLCLGNETDILFSGEAIDGSDGDRTPGTSHYNFHYVPRFSGTLGVRKQIRDLSLALLTEYTGEMKGAQSRVGPFTTVDLTVSWKQKIARFTAHHSLACRNLFAEDTSFPEYVRHRTLNAVPQESGRSFFYTFSLAY